MLYLVELVGTGAPNDPWQPPNWDGQGWIDLRGDCTIGGLGLVEVTAALPGQRVFKIADDLDENASAAARNQFSSRWGIVPSASRMRDVVAELLTQHGRLDRSRWLPLRRAKGRLRQEIFLRGRRIWEGPRLPPEPSTQTLTETWPTNGLTLSSGQDNPWTTVNGIPVVSAGVFTGNVNDASTLIRCDTPLDTDDHYHQADYVLGFASNNETFVIVRVRHDTAADTGYFARLAGDANTAGNRGHRLRKVVAGSGTNLYIDSNTPSSGSGTILCSADGSSIRYLCDGVDQTVTDTSITGHLRCGAEAKKSASNAASLDNHVMADIVAVHDVAVEQASETDTAQSITATKSGAVGQASETDTAQDITAQHRVAVEVASETAAAQDIQATKSGSVEQAAEADSALDIAAVKAVAVELSAEADSALDITPVKSGAVELATETDAAQEIVASKSGAVEQASEADTAQDITAQKSVPVELATETDSAFDIEVPTGLEVGLAEETDTAFDIIPVKVIAVEMAVETATALDIRPVKMVGLDLATEADEALAMVATKSGAVSQAVETDTAFDIVVSGGAPVITFGPTRFRNIVISRPGMASLAISRPGMSGIVVEPEG